LHNKNGDWIWFHYRGKVVSWTLEGEPEWMIGSYKEITQSTKEFKQHQEFISQAPTAIAMFDTNMCYLAYSKKWLTDFDLPDKTIIGKCHYAVFPEIGERWKKDYKECLEGKVLKSDEDYFIRQDGSSQWITWELRPWHTDTGKIGGVIIYSADITKRKAAEIKLRVSEEIFRGNFENAAIGMAIVGLKGKWKKVNTSICDMLGYTSDELYNLTIQEVTHPEDIQIGDKKMPELLSGKIPYIHLEKRYCN